jgi:hypothetical protein
MIWCHGMQNKFLILFLLLLNPWLMGVADLSVAQAPPFKAGVKTSIGV